MTILFIIFGFIAIGLVKNLICAAIERAGDKFLPKWNGEYVRNPITKKRHQVYNYGKWKKVSYGTATRTHRKPTSKP